MAPQLKSTWTGTFLLAKYFFGSFDKFGRDDLVGQILGALVGRILGDCKYPANLLSALLGVGEAGDGFDG